MKPLFSEIHIVGVQLSRLREIWEAIYEQYPPNADFASTYITLCTTIEYITALHLRTELEALSLYIQDTAPEGDSEWISEIDRQGNIHLYDQSRGRDALLRLIKKEVLGAKKLTHHEIDNLRKWLCGESLSEFYKTIEGTLCSDIKGLFALRHVFVHGSPLRLDADEKSPHHFDADGFSLKETVKTLDRVGLISKSTNLMEQTNLLHEAIFSYEAIQFYWNRVGLFAQRYVESVPHDLSYHSLMDNVLSPLKPLG